MSQRLVLERQLACRVPAVFGEPGRLSGMWLPASANLFGNSAATCQSATACRSATARQPATACQSATARQPRRSGRPQRARPTAKRTQDATAGRRFFAPFDKSPTGRIACPSCEIRPWQQPRQQIRPGWPPRQQIPPGGRPHQDSASTYRAALGGQQAKGGRLQERFQEQAPLADLMIEHAGPAQCRSNSRSLPDVQLVGASFCVAAMTTPDGDPKLSRDSIFKDPRR